MLPARELCVGRCDWDKIEVMGFVGQSEYLDSRRSGTFPVDGQVGGG